MLSTVPAKMQAHEKCPGDVSAPRGVAHRRYPMDAREFTKGKGCNNRKLSDADRAEVERLYTTRLPDGTWMGVSTIARQFGVANACIQYHLKRRGVTMRSAKEAHAHGKRCKPVKNLPVGAAPLCRCGCQQTTEWNQRKNRWSAYAPGHYQAKRLYHDPSWLHEQYVVERRTTAEIAAQFSTTDGTISRALAAAGIPARNPSDAHVGRQVGPKNPAWKGGVAKWDYAAGWKAIARKIRYRDNWTCQGCGEQRQRWGRDLHVHHRDGDKLNNDPANLVSLCVGCHRAAHATKGGGA